MTLCSNRPEGFVSLQFRNPGPTSKNQGPKSHLCSHILTFCFLDTILVPLCTWLYLLTVILLLSSDGRSGRWHRASSKDDDSPEKLRGAKRSIIARVFLVLYYLLILAQILMCILELIRLSLASLGIGLLPFTIVTLIVAGLLSFTRRLYA